jgi:hypothetical protein
MAKRASPITIRALGMSSVISLRSFPKKRCVASSEDIPITSSIPTMIRVLTQNAWAVSGGTALFAVPSARRPVLAGEPLSSGLARDLAALPTLITTDGYAYAAIALDELEKFYTERMAMARATSGKTNHPL